MKCIRKFTALVLSGLLLIAMLLLSGCREELTPAVTPTPGVTEPALGKTDGILRIPMPKAVEKFDPLQVKYDMMREVYSLVYERFLEVDSDRKASPNIAESWQYDPETGVWIFSIQRGIYWQGGKRELNAYDVTYTLDRIRNEDTVYTSLVKQEIVSYRELDLYRVEITPKNASLTLLYAMNFPVVPRDSEANGLNGGIAGTGPYQVGGTAEAEGYSVLKLKLNENWWKKKPVIEDIECVRVDDEQEAMNLYRMGKLDALTVPSDITGSFIQLGETGKLHYLTSAYDLLVPNHRNELLSQLPIRQAIAYSIDDHSLLTRVYGSAGVAADMPILPDSWLDRDDKLNYDYHVGRARELLLNEGWQDQDEDGVMEKAGQELAFTLLVVKDDNNRDQEMGARLIADFLQEAGMRITVETVSRSKLKTRLSEGDFDLAMVSVEAGYNPDISGIFASDAVKYCGYDFKVENELLAQLRTMYEEETFAQQYARLQDCLLSRLPFIGLYFRSDTFLYKYVTVTGTPTEGQVYEHIGGWVG